MNIPGRFTTPSKAVEWLDQTYHSKRSFSGVILFQPITDRNDWWFTSVLLELRSCSSITLITTQWELLEDEQEGKQREKKLQEHLSTQRPEHEDLVLRYNGHEASALAILAEIMAKLRTIPTAGAKSETHDHVDRNEGPGEGTQKAPPSTRKKIKTRRKKVKAKKIAKASESEMDFKQIEPHKPSIPFKIDQTPSSWPNMAFMPALALRENVLLSLSPIRELQRLLMPLLSRLLRPKLQTDHSRIEWTCVGTSSLAIRVSH